jgi:hypothetical protein
MNAELGITWEEINIAAGVLFVGIGYTTLLLGPAPFLYVRATNTRTRNECQYRLHVLQFSGSFGEMVGEGIFLSKMSPA